VTPMIARAEEVVVSFAMDHMRTNQGDHQRGREKVMRPYRKKVFLPSLHSLMIGISEGTQAERVFSVLLMTATLVNCSKSNDDSALACILFAR